MEKHWGQKGRIAGIMKRGSQSPLVIPNGIRFSTLVFNSFHKNGSSSQPVFKTYKALSPVSTPLIIVVV
ncbi:MAG: hypothetical protein AAB901_00365 [Patescibacteria group bacterium]